VYARLTFASYRPAHGSLSPRTRCSLARAMCSLARAMCSSPVPAVRLPVPCVRRPYQLFLPVPAVRSPAVAVHSLVVPASEVRFVSDTRDGLVFWGVCNFVWHADLTVAGFAVAGVLAAMAGLLVVVCAMAGVLTAVCLPAIASRSHFLVHYFASNIPILAGAMGA
jgi:hypothetical protein